MHLFRENYRNCIRMQETTLNPTDAIHLMKNSLTETYCTDTDNQFPATTKSDEQ